MKFKVKRFIIGKYGIIIRISIKRNVMLIENERFSKIQINNTFSITNK